MGETLSEALSEPTRPVSLGFQVLLGLATAGATISLIPVLTVMIPAQAAQMNPSNAANNLAFVLTLGASAALVSNPLAGALSDRTTSRFGRRRPWLLVGTLGVSAGLALLAGSQSIFFGFNKIRKIINQYIQLTVYKIKPLLKRWNEENKILQK